MSKTSEKINSIDRCVTALGSLITSQALPSMCCVRVAVPLTVVAKQWLIYFHNSSAALRAQSIYIHLFAATRMHCRIWEIGHICRRVIGILGPAFGISKGPIECCTGPASRPTFFVRRSAEFDHRRPFADRLSTLQNPNTSHLNSIAMCAHFIFISISRHD